MKIDILSLDCKKAFIKLVYHVIVDWSIAYDYSIPSMTWFSNYAIKLLNCEAYTSTYNGSDIEAIGTHFTGQNLIHLAAKREKGDVLGTLLHELGHAVQYFNLGDKFSKMYSAEAKNREHFENKFEDEARALQRAFRKLRVKDTTYRHITNNFEFTFEPKPRPIPPKREKKDFFPEGYYYDRPDFSDPTIKHTRKQWWLYR